MHVVEQNCDLHMLSECCHSCQGCFLLLLLKQHLKKSFGLSDRSVPCLLLLNIAHTQIH